MEEDDDATVPQTTTAMDHAAGENESAAVIPGGTDDISPLQLWDSIMRQYGVMQRCDEESRQLERAGKLSDATDSIKQSRLQAVEAAIHALRQLTNKEIREKLIEATRHL